jgi:acetylornithine deacetylase/succinyl-diaminopimelate desuccinylase-like protein
MDRAVQYLKSLVSIPTVSSKPEHHHDLKKGATAVVDILKDVGFAHIERWPTTTDVDCVYAEHIVDPDAKTLLIYGHYDVQPIDPIEDWESDPFTLTQKGDWLHGRGAEDNKGQLCCVFSGLYQNLPDRFNIKMLIEGEEESSSKGLYDLIEKKKERLKADYLLIFDVDMISLEKGAVTCGTRGVYGFDIQVKTGISDLHSGMFGGIARSATLEMNYLLSKMLGPEGEILVDGFYDEVMHISQHHKDQYSFYEPDGDFAKYDFSKTSAKDRNYFLPTLEINGFYSGHMGSGSKTVIPCEAYAKMTIRTVNNQDGFELIEKIDTFLQKVKHPGCSVKVLTHSGGPFSFTNSHDHFIQKLHEAYRAICPLGSENILSGASIPVASSLQKITNATLAFAGVGLKEDFIHSPHERFSLKQIDKGVKFIKELVRLLNVD